MTGVLPATMRSPMSRVGRFRPTESGEGLRMDGRVLTKERCICGGRFGRVIEDRRVEGWFDSELRCADCGRRPGRYFLRLSGLKVYREPKSGEPLATWRQAFRLLEKIRGEKQSIGYGVSGHGLDGLKPYVDRRTVGMEHIVEWKKKMSERVVVDVGHQEEENGEEVGMNLSVHPENNLTPALPINTSHSDPLQGINNDKRTGLQAKTKKEAMKRVRLIGLVTSVRLIQTKTGKMMAVATCDSFDFKFTILVFSKEYEALSPLLEEDKILLVEGILRGNEENGEMAVTAQTIRASTITSIRQQANDVNLFDARTLVNLSGFTEEVCENTESGTSEIKENLPMETDIQETGEEDEGVNPYVHPKEYVITVPSSACRQDLVDLKTYLEGFTKGSIQVFIDIQ